MKKFFTRMFAVAAATAFALTSCGKDDDSPSDIVGEWYLSGTEGYSYEGGEREDVEQSHEKADSWLYWTLFSDGTGVIKDIKDLDKPLFFDIAWSMGEGLLYVKTGGAADTFIIHKLTSSTLKIQWKGTNEDSYYKYGYIFTKLK